MLFRFQVPVFEWHIFFSLFKIWLSFFFSFFSNYLSRPPMFQSCSAFIILSFKIRQYQNHSDFVGVYQLKFDANYNLKRFFLLFFSSECLVDAKLIYLPMNFRLQKTHKFIMSSLMIVMIIIFYQFLLPLIFIRIKDVHVVINYFF